MSNISDEKLKSILSCSFQLGREKTRNNFNLSDETLNRYLREGRKRGFGEAEMNISERKPQVLVLDIETLPILGTFWRTGKQHISHEHILKDVCLLSYAVKWLFEPDIYSDILTPDEAVQRDDKRIVSKIWSFVNDADVIIAHNGIRFDMRQLNAHFIRNKFDPPAPYQMIDTYKVSSSVADFSSHKQAYLNKFLKLPEKIQHEGLALWHKCMFGEKDALDMMLEYNIGDTFGLEELYITLRPWMKSHPNLSLYYHVSDEPNVERCHRCNSGNIEWLFGNGKDYTTSMNRYSSYRCRDCGGIGKSRQSQLTTEDRRYLTSSVAR